MNKKIISLVLGTVMTIGSITGTTGAVYAGEDETKDIVEIFWQYPAMNEVGEGFYRVEDALNEMMERDIGVHVTLVPTGLLESQQDATLMISSGEQLDISLTAFTGIGNMVESGLIQSIDDIVEEAGSDILEQCGTAVDGCYYDGELYGVPTCAYINSQTYGYNMKKQYCDKYGFEHDDNKIYTMEELDEMFAIVKEGEGENFYMMTPWNNTQDPLNYCYIPVDKLGGDFAAGVLMLNRSFDDLTVYDQFETPEYAEYCQMMYDWAQKGYIAADATVDTDYSIRAADDNYLGNFAYGAPDSSMLDTNNAWNEEVVLFRTIDNFIPQNGGQGLMWNIPITSANPEKAIEAINYLYKNKEAAWLIQFGFEGEEYEVVEDNGTDKVIKYLSDDLSALPYWQVYGIYGNRLEWPAVYPSPIDYNSRLKEREAAVSEDRYSPALGYIFKQESVSAEIAAVETVIEQYFTSFNSGALNPDEALPDFIEALKAAGMDKIIAENQRQLDEWAANR